MSEHLAAGNINLVNARVVTNLVIAAGLLGQRLVPLTVKLLIQVVNLVVIIHVQVVTHSQNLAGVMQLRKMIAATPVTNLKHVVITVVKMILTKLVPPEQKPLKGQMAVEILVTNVVSVFIFILDIIMDVLVVKMPMEVVHNIDLIPMSMLMEVQVPEQIPVDIVVVLLVNLLITIIIVMATLKHQEQNVTKLIKANFA